MIDRRTAARIARGVNASRGSNLSGCYHIASPAGLGSAVFTDRDRPRLADDEVKLRVPWANEPRWTAADVIAMFEARP